MGFLSDASRNLAAVFGTDELETLIEFHARYPDHPDILRAAIKASRHADVLVRASGTALLGRSGARGQQDVVRQCVAGLFDKQSLVRLASAMAVVELDIEQRLWRQRMEELVEDRSAAVRVAAIAALNRVEHGAVSATKQFSRCLELLKSHNAHHRVSACHELRHSAAAAVPYLRDVMDAMLDTKPSVRDAAARAAGAILTASSEGRAQALAFLNDRNHPEHHVVLGVITRLHEPLHPDLLPAIQVILDDDSHPGQGLALHLVAMMGGARSDLCPTLLRIAISGQPALRRQIVRILHVLPLSSHESTILLSGIVDSDPELRYEALVALGRRPELIPKAAPRLVDLFVAGSDLREQREAGGLLLEGKVVSDLAKERIKCLVNHPDEDIRFVAETVVHGRSSLV